MKHNYSENNLAWIDTEFTGLNFENEHLLEVALVITDKDLNILNDGLVIAINQPDEILLNMNDWSKEHHKDSGLIERVKNSRISMSQAELKLIEEMKSYIPQNYSPMCGNTIFADRFMLRRQMPRFEEYFFYRNIDVSSIKELYKRWRTGKPLFLKKENHLALADIKESIEELKFYLDQGFIQI